MRCLPATLRFSSPASRNWFRATWPRGASRRRSSLSDALEEADIALICVGTPSERNGNLGLEQLRRVAGEIGELSQRPQPAAHRRRSQHGLSGHVRTGGCAGARRSGARRRGLEPGVSTRGRGGSRFHGALAGGGGQRGQRGGEARRGTLRPARSGALPRFAAHGGDDQVRLQCLPRAENRVRQRDRRDRRGVGHRRRRGDGHAVPRRAAEYLSRLPQTRVRLRRLLPAQGSARPGLSRGAAGSRSAADAIDPPVEP